MNTIKYKKYKQIMNNKIQNKLKVTTMIKVVKHTRTRNVIIKMMILIKLNKLKKINNKRIN